MRNFSSATVAQTEAFRATNYDVALEWARTEQKAAPENVSYTIDKNGEDTVVTKHEGFNGGVPPYQPIVHK
jgi:hypothetical protein